ncbi:type II secretion system major pseudopilin GspG [Deferrisoma palaeochoriense]
MENTGAGVRTGRRDFPFPGRSASNAEEGETLRFRGFTLIEILIVVAIIGLLASLVSPRLFSKLESSKVKTAKAQIEMLATACDTFRLDVGRYPRSLEELRHSTEPGWDGPYLPKEIPKDPWGNPYLYKVPGDHGDYDIISLGADGQPGGEGNAADIGSWE